MANYYTYRLEIIFLFQEWYKIHTGLINQPIFIHTPNLLSAYEGGWGRAYIIDVFNYNVRHCTTD